MGKVVGIAFYRKRFQSLTSLRPLAPDFFAGFAEILALPLQLPRSTEGVIGLALGVGLVLPGLLCRALELGEDVGFPGTLAFARHVGKLERPGASVRAGVAQAGEGCEFPASQESLEWWPSG
jgi:hypothetical protein